MGLCYNIGMHLQRKGREYLNSELYAQAHLLQRAWSHGHFDICCGKGVFIRNEVKCIVHFTTHIIPPYQLTQWRHFEEDQNNPSQMAKYFSSPSKSQPSVYSQEEIYYLLGENNSMKKLLSEVR